jgi:hypothetical protein
LRLARALPRRVRGPVLRAAFALLAVRRAVGDAADALAPRAFLAAGSVIRRLRHESRTAVRAVSDSQGKRFFFGGVSFLNLLVAELL